MLWGYLHCPEAAGTPPGSPSRGSSAPAGSRGPAGLWAENIYTQSQKVFGTGKYCELSAVPGHVLAVDGENLVAGHELVHAGAAAGHEPGTGNSSQLSLDEFVE